MTHSPDDLAYLAQLQAEHPDQAKLIRDFARQNGLPVPPVPTTPMTWPTPPAAGMPEPPVLPDSSTAASTDEDYWGRRPPIDTESCPPPDPTLPPLPPSAAQVQTGAALQGDELMAAVIARRRVLGLTQAEFATRLGISLRTYQEWEQGRRRPSGPAEVILRRTLQDDDMKLHMASP